MSRWLMIGRIEYFIGDNFCSIAFSYCLLEGVAMQKKNMDNDQFTIFIVEHYFKTFSVCLSKCAAQKVLLLNVPLKS